MTLSVYDRVGQVVITLVEREEQAGYHEVKLEGSGLDSGMYFDRIIPGSCTKTMKMLQVDSIHSAGRKALGLRPAPLPIRSISGIFTTIRVRWDRRPPRNSRWFESFVAVR